MSTNIDQIKQQLLQLQQLAQQGVLPSDQYEQAKAKLERQMVDLVMSGADTASQASPAQTKKPVPTRLWVGMGAFVLAFGAAGYAWLGHPDGLSAGPVDRSAPTSAGADRSETVQTGASAPHSLGSDQIAAMTESLAAKLKAKPDNPEGWAMLGRSYAVLGRWDDAISAYQKSIAQRSDDAQVYADYADALGVQHGRKLDGEPQKLIEKALSIDPKNFKALFLSGTVLFEQGAFAKAAEQWTKAIQHAPTDNPELTKQIQASLDEARQKAGIKGEPVAATDTSISGRVTLSKALAGKVSPTDTVFVFARPKEGSRMPLAILRQQVKDLPSNFVLDDSLAMSPQARLSGASEVIVGARVSKSGQAMPQPGDLQGLSAPVKVGAKGLNIEINETIP